VGEEIDVIVVHTSPVEEANYLAFSTLNPRKTGLAESIWLYREYGGAYEKIWHKEIDKGTKFGFADVPSEPATGLAVNEPQQCGSDACSKMLTLFVLEQRKEYSILYHDEGAAFFEENDYNAQDPKITAWLRSWARKLGIYPQRVPDSQLSNPENIEEAWRNDNGYKANGIVKLRYYKTLPPSYLSAVKTTSGIPKKAFVGQVDDGRYAWSAYFKAGVVGYDKESHQYFMVYLPKDRSDWIRKLAMRGQWLYMSEDCDISKVFSENNHQVQDQDCIWTLKYNKQTHALEQGKFDTHVKQGALTAESGDRNNPHNAMKKEENPDLIYLRGWVSRDPRNANAHYSLGGYLLNYGHSSRDLDEAIAELRLATLLDPNMADAHMTLAGALMRKGETQEALKEAAIGNELWRQNRR
jgi:tetratricopeptide (TPR) repeat protein